MTTHFRILLGASIVLSCVSVTSLQAQPQQSAAQRPNTRVPQTLGEASKPVAVSVVTSKEVDGKPEVITLTGHLVQRFQYQIGSFKPVELPGVNLAAGGMMGSGSMGSMGGYDSMGSGSMGPMGGGGMMGGPGMQGDGSAASQPSRTITILALVLNERLEDGRAKIELLTDLAISRGPRDFSGGSMMGSGMSGYGGGMMGGGDYGMEMGDDERRGFSNTKARYLVKVPWPLDPMP